MTQSQALDILKTGANVFLTGEPGAGKTFVLNEYIAWLDAAKVSVAVTASTGIAATHIGGMTIHSWSGAGARTQLSEFDLDRITSKEKLVQRIKKTHVLIIDEISMLDGRLLDGIEQICRTIRANGEAFGGMQVILVGDFFQLPPIADRGTQPVFAFESNAWRRAQMLTCYLSEQHRHEDELLTSLLSSIRKGEVEEEHYTLLSEQKEIAYEGVEPTRLFTHNKNVDELNENELKGLDTSRAAFAMDGKGNKAALESLTKSCLSPSHLELRLEAMVMCTKNNFEAGYVNGTLGRVIDFDPQEGWPIIETSDGREIKIMPSTWSLEEDGKVLAEVTQVPLRLAWAITVHKSQGMSLDAAEIDLRNAFTYGQGYVALSRVRTLAGMKVLGLNANSLMVDPKVIAADARFQESSNDVETAFAQMEQEELINMHTQFVEAGGGTLPKPGEKVERASGERIKKESTYAQTYELLKAGKSVKAIAKERDMAISTIWSHVEKLADDKTMSRKELEAIAATTTNWSDAYQELSLAMEEVGTEKLKPIYETAGEKYDYDQVRLARLLYTH